MAAPSDGSQATAGEARGEGRGGSMHSEDAKLPKTMRLPFFLLVLIVDFFFWAIFRLRNSYRPEKPVGVPWNVSLGKIFYITSEFLSPREARWCPLERIAE